MKKDMKIIYESDSMPRAFESVRRDLAPAVKTRLKEVLLKAHLDPKAKGALDSYQKTKQFTGLDNETKLELQEMRNDLHTVIKASK